MGERDRRNHTTTTSSSRWTVRLPVLSSTIIPILWMASAVAAQSGSSSSFPPRNLALSDFQLITSAAVPRACIREYNRKMGCTTRDFTQEYECSTTCVNGLLALQTTLQSVCGTADDLEGIIPRGSLLDRALRGELLFVLCPDIADDLPPPSKTTTRATTTQSIPTMTVIAPSTTTTASRPSSSSASETATTRSSSQEEEPSSTSSTAEVTSSSSLPEVTETSSLVLTSSSNTQQPSPTEETSPTPEPTPPPSDGGRRGGGSPFDVQPFIGGAGGSRRQRLGAAGSVGTAAVALAVGFVFVLR